MSTLYILGRSTVHSTVHLSGSYHLWSNLSNNDETLNHGSSISEVLFAPGFNHAFHANFCCIYQCSSSGRKEGCTRPDDADHGPRRTYKKGDSTPQSPPASFATPRYNHGGRWSRSNSVSGSALALADMHSPFVRRSPPTNVSIADARLASSAC